MGFRIAADIPKAFASRQAPLQKRFRRVAEHKTFARANSFFGGRAARTSKQIAADTDATTSLVFLVSEEAAVADELGNLWWYGFVPGFVPAGDALKHVS